MAGITYEVHIGSGSASSAHKDGDLVLLSAWAELDMDGIGGRCSIELAMTGTAPPKPGDAVTVELGDDGGESVVFTGEVQRIAVAPATIRVVATDGLSKLASFEVEAAYEKTAAGAIAKEILQKAGLTAGTIEDGPKFPSYVLRRGSKALRHLQRLADESGCDVYTDGGGKVHFAKPKQGSADHTFEFEKHVLDFALEAARLANDGVVVWGEGAASTKGDDKFYWLTGDLKAVSGKASIDAKNAVKPGSAGTAPLTVQDGAVRASADATDQAKARMARLASRAVRGSLDVLGRAAVKPGDLVKIDKLPAKHAASALVADNALRVRRVRHALSLERGFVTRMGF